ncbi:MAG: tryptophan 7-halogenase [Aphanothece sp. CMT-3BRIN-NPC111]|jgi:tryptophan halogenase|nr:tryptophan 7-halogenase [Aphanothece sp. CMT-3BRIN-NPC111]
MKDKVEQIVIVGGGTAGWLAALFLDRALNSEPHHHVNITLIESSDIGTVGVGEATVPHLRDTFAYLGIDEDDWMVNCNATFKAGIKFVNWTGLPENDVFWSPFEPFPSPEQLEAQIFNHLGKQQSSGGSLPFDFSCFKSVRLCEAKKSPKIGVESPYVGQTSYAYHLDAGLLAAYLKQIAISRGVKHIVGNVLDVALDKDGFISHLKMDLDVKLYGDLFIDCSGFQGLLINKTLKEPFISFSNFLPCDSAIAINAPYDVASDKEIDPYTTATALSSGWVWSIPLFNRRGTGYVYSSAFISATEAETEFREHLGVRSYKAEAKHIKMRVGKNKNLWVKNCVSVGLAGGFIEPLESTGIYLIEIGMKYLSAYFPSRGFDPILTNTYNAIMDTYYESIRDFIVMHYCMTNREDTPFWQHQKYEPILPETLKSKLESWRAIKLKKGLLVPSLALFEGKAFGKYLHLCILAGMNYLPEPNLLSSSISNAESANLEPKGGSDDALLGHYQYLSNLHQGNISAFRETFARLCAVCQPTATTQQQQ